MGFEDYISEVEASALVGVSPATLCRFAEAGYLQVEQDADGLRLFSKGELAAVFSIEVEKRDKATGAATADTRQDELSPVEPLDTSNAQSQDESADANEETLEDPAQAAEHLAADSDDGAPLDAPPLRSESTASRNEEIAPMDPLPPPAEIRVSAPVRSEGGAIRATPRGDEGASLKIAALEEERIRQDRELTRFRHLVDMQERLLDLYERQIKEMKTERDWLRQRVERSEEKHDRDQLLLLSETQTIRKLVAHQESRKSSLQYALEWFGFASTASQGSRGASARPAAPRLAASIESSRTPSAGRAQPMTTSPRGGGASTGSGSRGHTQDSVEPSGPSHQERDKPHA